MAQIMKLIGRSYTRLLSRQLRKQLSPLLIEIAGSVPIMTGKNWVNLPGYRLFFDPHDLAGKHLWLAHLVWGFGYSSERAAWLECLRLNPGSVAFDLGANYGRFSLDACCLEADCRPAAIISVEPNRDVYHCLTRSIDEMAPEVRIVPVLGAVLDRHGGQCMFAAPRSSFLGRVFPPETASPPESAQVPAYSVDGLVKDHNISADNYFVLKIDIQGSEPLALKGMLETLRNARGYQIVVEFSHSHMTECGHDSLQFAADILELQADFVAEISDTDRSFIELQEVSDFAGLIDREKNEWDNIGHTNILVSKGMALPEKLD